MIDVRVMAAAAVLAVGLSACGGGGGSPPTTHLVTIAWDPNRESGVNRAGGGYQVSISRGFISQPAIDVPHTSGPTAPTSTTVSLLPGTYTVTVRAYAALDPQGGTNISFSAPSQPLTVNVP